MSVQSKFKKMAQRRQIVLLDTQIGPEKPKEEEKTEQKPVDLPLPPGLPIPPGLAVPASIVQKNTPIEDKIAQKNKRLAKQLENANFIEVDSNQLLNKEEDSSKDKDPSLAQVLYGKNSEHQANVANRFADPTKLQKKRHQINAMAIEAAAMELELLEQHQKGKRLRQETKSKYGW
jgi:hypothetical protein